MASIADQLARIFARPIAHRGLHGCGGDGPVENTIGAARAAIAKGYGIECDVQLTRDGQAMIFHDDTLERLTGGTGAFNLRSEADIADLTLRDGSRISALPSFLAAIAGQVALVIEIKSGNGSDMRLADAVLAQVQDYGGPIALESFDAAVVARCRRAACPIGFVGPSEDQRVNPDALPRCDFVSWNVDQVATVAMKHAHLPRSTWTVRTPAQWRHAIEHAAQIVFEGFRP